MAEGVRCGDRYMMVARVGLLSSMFLIAQSLFGMARHNNMGGGFTGRGSRGAFPGSRRDGGCA
jgi:hypothetical protein